MTLPARPERGDRLYRSLEAGISSGSTFVGSDHYPIFGDYNIVVLPPATPVLNSLGITNGYYKFKLVSSTNIAFGVQGCTNLTGWTNIGSGFTDTNGLMFFQDTNTAGFRYRFLPGVLAVSVTASYVSACRPRRSFHMCGMNVTLAPVTPAEITVLLELDP